MITFVSWRWYAKHYRTKFEPYTVYALRDMIAEHYKKPHRFVCVTDQPNALPGIETIPIWNDWAEVKSNIGTSYPSCYRRLKLFAPDAGQTFGQRVVSCDLDTVIVKDITSLFDRDEDFVIWGESDFQRQACCGSLFMLKTGTRPQVWTEFEGEKSKVEAWKAGCRGSDQGWISYVLGVKHGPWNEARWNRDHGVYSYRKHVAKLGGHLPEQARLVPFHGKIKPWDSAAQQFAWVRQYYPLIKKTA